MKDPAFLFYSQDFYAGTRLMLPAERACYIDLLIYQHQNEYIPNNIDRVLMFCAGVDKATLEATLEAKFKLGDKGWYNEKLKSVIEQRQEYTSKQSDNGVVGQFFKKAKASLKLSEYKQVKEYIYSEFGKDRLVHILKNNETTHEATLKGLLKHLENEIENEIKDLNNNKGVKLPFDSNQFKNQWNLWLDYKTKEFKFKYKSTQSEQAALTELNNLAGGSEEKAIKIIHKSMAGGWKGFFELKESVKKTESAWK